MNLHVVFTSETASWTTFVLSNHLSKHFRQVKSHIIVDDSSVAVFINKNNKSRNNSGSGGKTNNISDKNKDNDGFASSNIDGSALSYHPKLLILSPELNRIVNRYPSVRTQSENWTTYGQTLIHTRGHSSYAFPESVATKMTGMLVRSFKFNP